MHKRIRVFWLCAMLGAIAVTSPARAALVINEVDYDQPGTDGAEFVELFNSGPDSLGLDGYSLDLINGTTAAPYAQIALDGQAIAAHGFFVICGNPGNVVNCNLDAGPDTNLIQNGAPDGVALRTGDQVIDALTYEGTLASPYGEGSGDGLADSNSLDFVGLSRLPDGIDTNDNQVDFSLRCISPGTANNSSANGCSAPQSVPINVVPVPGSTGLLAAGLSVLAGFSEFGRRRGRRCTDG